MSYAERTKRPPRTLTDREMKKILDVTGKAKDGFRDHMIISFALGCGLRESEILALTIDDVARPDGKTPKRIIKLRIFKRSAADAKPGDHYVHVPDATYYKLEKYLASMKAWEFYRDFPLFRSRQSGDQPMTTRQVRRMFRGWQDRAGFDRPYNFHCLRHTAVTNVRKISSIKHAQRFARHANIATTARYDHVSDEELAAAVKGLPA